MKPAANTLHSELIPARDASSRRLLIMLHGLGDSIAGFRWLPPALNLPWLNYLFVNAPDQYYGGYFLYLFLRGKIPGGPPNPKHLFFFLDAQRLPRLPAGPHLFCGLS